MKSTLDLRPVFHRREDRIRSHVTLCWLALLMIRLAENRTGYTWAHIRRQTQRIHQVTLTGPDGAAEHLTRPTAEQNQLFTAAGLTPPKRLTGMAPAALPAAPGLPRYTPHTSDHPHHRSSTRPSVPLVATNSAERRPKL